MLNIQHNVFVQQRENIHEHNSYIIDIQFKFEDMNWVIRNRKSNDRQHRDFKTKQT